MRTIANKKTRLWLALVVASAGLAVLGAGASHASPASVTINLCALENPTASLTGAVTVPIWGFADGGTGASPDCSSVTASLPGPVYTVNEGDEVTINVANGLPADPTPATPGTTDHVVSLEIPGVSFDALSDADGAAVGDTASYSFTASAPGTYLYESAGDAGRQEAMGLYGALIVRPTSAPDTPIDNQAYHAASTAYDVQATLVLSQVDPSFNADPDGFDMNDYLATYWLINGKAYPDTANITVPGEQKVLLRYLNAGYDNTAMSLLGMHEQVLARDANLLNNPFAAGAETLPAGGTEDTIATMPSFAPPTANGFPLYNRNLHVTNGPALLNGNPLTPNANYTPGGMLTFITP